MRPAAIEFQAVTKRYGATIAVDGISFTAEPGTLTTLLGPSGCGKTTTLRLIAGLERASAGRIFIAGHEVTQLPASQRNVSMVFQSYALFPHMTVLENVAYGPTVAGMPRRQAQEMARGKLALLGLSGFDRRYPAELSGGQQQRVAVARALVLEPLVLLFDEPLSNLDAKLRRQVRDDIRALQQRLNLTVVYVTHDQQEAMAVSDQIIVMSQATIAQKGRPRDLYEEPANLFVADFIGDANIVDATLADIAGERARVVLADLELHLPHRGIAAGPIKLAIRPDALLLNREIPLGPALTARVAKAAYLGTHMEYTIDCALGLLFVVERSTSHAHPVGGDVWLSFGDTGITVIRS